MTDLSGDPIFQLNTVLWMLQPTPSVSSPIKAVLRDAGYGLRAIAPKLTVPAPIEAELAEKLKLSASPPEPDVLASAPDEHPWPVFECKASSFSPDSSTAGQARKLLGRAKELALVVGSPPGKSIPGAVVYATRVDQGEQLVTTLYELRAEMLKEGVTTAPASVIGLGNAAGQGVTAVLVGGDLPGPAATALQDPVVIVLPSDDQDETRPLYLLPFDPSVEQAAPERQYCLRVLLERARSHVAGMLGRAEVQSTVVVEGLDVLREATYGVSDYWRATKERDKAARMAVNFCKNVLRNMKTDPPAVFTPQNTSLRIEVHVAPEQQRVACAEALLAAHLPGDLEQLGVEQQALDFDGAGQSGPSLDQGNAP